MHMFTMLSVHMERKTICTASHMLTYI